MRAGLQIGQFVLERPLGEGGMAEVWLGQNVHLGTPVAVKFLNMQFAGNPEMQARFLEEGRRQAELNHPNIVRVYGWEMLEGRSFLILQYVHGEPLDLRLQRTGPLPADLFFRVTEGILSALHHAHSMRMVHRDVKPSNILLDMTGHPYLGDFGLVLAFDQQRLTRTGTSMGTPEYMSPEQITNPATIDHRSDIYSLGCVLYEMLTGRVPFGGQDFQAKMAHLQQAPPPLRQWNPTIPAALEQVVLRCLAKQPAERFGSCAEVHAALSAAMRGPAPVQAPPPSRRGLVTGLLAGLAAVAVGGGGYGYYRWRKGNEPEPAAPPDVPPAKKKEANPGVDPQPKQPPEQPPEQPPQQPLTPKQEPEKTDPPVEPAAPAPVTPPAAAGTGSFLWSGKTDKGDRVTITGLSASMGTVRGTAPPADQWLEVRLNNPDFGVAEAPSPGKANRIVLRAGRSGDLKVTVYWSVVQ